MMRAAVGIASVLLVAACASAPRPAQTPASAPVTVQGSPGADAVVLTTPTGAIEGTLLMPAGGGARVPVALLIAGSGPTDRDGNSVLLPGKNDSLRMIAEALAAEGIASLRYDKRGVGASVGAALSESDLRFGNYIDDAAAWVEMLRMDPRFGTVTVIGHSEGSLIGIIAAGRAGADGVVSIAGMGRRVPEVLRAQLRPQLTKELWDESERILERLAAGETTDAVPPVLAMLYRPSVQPYLISWMAYDPVAEIARLEVPVLVTQGTTDIQATPEDAETLHRAAPRSEIAIIPGMNHVLKSVGEDRAQQIASYSDPSLPLTADFAPRIVRFIRQSVGGAR